MCSDQNPLTKRVSLSNTSSRSITCRVEERNSVNFCRLCVYSILKLNNGIPSWRQGQERKEMCDIKYIILNNKKKALPSSTEWNSVLPALASTAFWPVIQLCVSKFWHRLRLANRHAQMRRTTLSTTISKQLQNHLLPVKISLKEPTDSSCSMPSNYKQINMHTQHTQTTSVVYLKEEDNTHLRAVKKKKKRLIQSLYLWLHSGSLSSLPYWYPVKITLNLPR